MEPESDFKSVFKYYKSRNPTPTFKDVLDLHTNNKYSEDVIKRNPNTNVKNVLGLKKFQYWEIYETLTIPGLIYIKNPFTSIGQRYWMVRCLQDYTKRPNKLNIDPHGFVSENNHWWDLAKSNSRKWIEKLRWATLGYHHNWDTKIYSENATDFPLDLKLLCKYIGNVLGFNNFEAQAAIINFYHMDSTLSGHTDHSEQNLDAPLFSLSFGQSAVFLIGENLYKKPLALKLHSGDIVVMSKEARLCYHGVPRILNAVEKPWNDEIEEDGDNLFNCDINTFVQCKNNNFFKPFCEYIEHSRINVNVRQVLKPGQQYLE